jgi:hypothetical protein
MLQQVQRILTLIRRVSTGSTCDVGDTKLELILQFIQDEDIDVMVCIDSQLDEKKGHWYGKNAKRRLGIGTRTNVNPCILDYGTEARRGS